MTKEELEKAYYTDRPTEPYSDDDKPNDWANIAHYAEDNLEKAFKRIAELEKKIKSLEGNSSLREGILWNDIHNQDKKIAELEAQIEKMKCCYNCKHSRTEYEHCRTDKHEKWEIKEK